MRIAARLLLLLPALAGATPVHADVEVTPAAAGVSASTHDGNLPANTVDDSLSTRWSANGDGQWLRFDLGSTRTVTYVAIAVFNGNVRSAKFDLQTSTDGAAWTTVLANAQSSGTTTLEQAFDFADSSARYVRYLGHGNTVNLWNSLSEVSIFAANPTPTPTPTFTPTPTPTPTPTATPTPTPAPGGSCNTMFAGGAWHTAWLASAQSGSFTAQFDASVSVSPSNAVVGLSQGVATSYAGFASMVRFNPTGQIDARNGGVYAAATTVNYAANVSYHFRLVVNVVARTYSVYVRPAGGTEQTLGVDFAFRTEQAGVTSIDAWGASVNATASGSMTVCDVATTALGAGPGADLPAPIRTFNVSSLAALQSQLDAAVAGDHIVLVDGTYTTASAVNMTRSGTAAAPIVVRAASVGGATIGGSAGFTFSNASHVVVYGFRFTHSSPQQVPVGSNGNRFARNTFQLAATVKYWLEVFADDTEVDHNTFQNKSTLGVYVSLQGPGSTGMALRTQIHHNYFFNHTFPEANGGESLRAGVSARALSSSHTVIEYNLFEQANGDPEAISLKSSDNTVRYNTLRDSTGCIVLRHGNRDSVYGNFLLGTGCGVRIYGNDHKVYGNYFAGITGDVATIGSGDVQDHYEGETTTRTGKDAADRVQFAFNTLADNLNDHIKGEDRTYAPRDCVIANNVVVGNNAYALVDFGDAPIAFTWLGNLFWGSSANGEVTAGFQRVDPLLVLSEGVYKLGAGSPAIDAAQGTYADVTVDIDGQTRGAAKDVGADEYSAAVIVRRPLTTADVGPSAP